MNDLLGIKIVVNPLIQPTPKLQISAGFEWCSDAKRIEINQWLRDLFGVEYRAYMIGGTMFAHPETMSMFKTHCA